MGSGYALGVVDGHTSIKQGLNMSEPIYFEVTYGSRGGWRLVDVGDMPAKVRAGATVYGVYGLGGIGGVVFFRPVNCGRCGIKNSFDVIDSVSYDIVKWYDRYQGGRNG